MTDAFGALPIIRPRASRESRGICAAFYGAPGAGKTTLAAEVAQSKYGAPALLVDCEGNTHVLAHHDNDSLHIVQPHTWREVSSVVSNMGKMLKDKSFPYRTVIFDNLSEIANMCADGIAPAEGFQLQHYRVLTTRMLELAHDLRDFTRFYPVNVIFIAWETVERISEITTRKNLYFTPKLAEAFPGIMNMVGYISVHERRGVYTRRLSFAPSPDTQAKFNRAPTDNAQHIPLEIYYNLDDIMSGQPMCDLLDTLIGDAPWNSSKYLAPSRSASAERSNTGNASS